MSAAVARTSPVGAPAIAVGGAYAFNAYRDRSHDQILSSTRRSLTALRISRDIQRNQIGEDGLRCIAQALADRRRCYGNSPLAPINPPIIPPEVP